MRKYLVLTAALSALAFGGTASAQNTTTVTVAPDAVQGLVFKTIDHDTIQAPSLRGGPGVSCQETIGTCMNTAARDPNFLIGAEACISNTGANWSLEADGTQSRDPARQPFCAPIVDGKFSITAPLRENATPYIRKRVNGVWHYAGWIDRKSLVGITAFTGYE